MINPLPPAAILILGALPVIFLQGKLRKGWLLLLPVLSFLNLLLIPEGTHWTVSFMDYDLIFGQVDRLSLIFGYIFHLIAIIATLYALHVEDAVQNIAGLVYAGAALGVTFAGDFFSLFAFWEILTISATFLILARRTPTALGAGFRYFMVHVAGGLCLLAGIIIHVQQSGSAAFGYLGLEGLASYLIFFGFGVNCAWPFLHTWLTDAYPEGTITGTIFLSAFTTKTAVYVLARAFPGTEALIWIGVAMAGFPIFYAVIENDLRKVLAYSLINQVGFMVVGIGIGSELAVNGAVAHAFNDVLFKGLLFMSMGAVMYRTGKINATDLGGLYRSMPWTCTFCIVGAASISAFPLFSGFVSKSMVMEAAARGDLRFVWFVLLFASAGVFHHAGIKIPFFAFFSHDSGLRCKEAPRHMLLAMGGTAVLCILIGCFPQYLYNLLPFATDYQPYTASHVVAQTQLLFFSALAFTLLLLSGIYPAEIRAINIDADWFYRKGGRAFYALTDKTFNTLNRWGSDLFMERIPALLSRFFQEPGGSLQKYGVDLYAEATGTDEDDILRCKSQIDRRSKSAAYPVGGGVLLAVLFLALMSVLFFR
ncbi:multisubunit sodium/proton antiporter, MrpD subunit [Desulfuromonas soudanensis]|uniref:Multisubunit sodium/proton antiporter, MrpD subunit n=1 Tax=Desulfuromonas soudanensis TaxID=1603606 RepID=A0A0M3QES5_9BACT|nr:Na(+)/H(+) antiporter subunit D [Desulfuromonas soudanensis]ALC14979.1 multisubunit sodium/proton antiporter, MrpD subunit [Desulfuromonas soudanensis]